MSPTVTLTGVFGWLYVAVVFVLFFNAVTSTCGILEFSFSNLIPFTAVMNFLNDKSNGFGTLNEASSAKL